MATNLKLVTSPVIPAFEEAVRNNSPRALRIPESLRQRVAASRKDAKVYFERILKPAKPYPGVVPDKIAMDTKLAMDQNEVQIAGWASNWANSSSLIEGQGFLGYAALAELAQRPEYRAICETLAFEMTREGVEFKSAGGDEGKAEKLTKIEGYWKQLRIMPAAANAALYDAFMGRSHLYLDVGVPVSEHTTPDPETREELRSDLGDGNSELSASKVSPRNPLRRLVHIEPVWTYPTRYNSSNPLHPTWYKPVTWFVMGTEIHASRLLTFIGREVPDLLKPAYSFGGLSMSQMAMPYVNNWLRTRQSVADLIWSFSVFILKTNMSETMQVDGEQLFHRAELFNNMRNNQGLMLLDKDQEDFVNVSASLGGLHELQAQSQEHMAAVSRIPIVKLLGIQPAGLNASSEGEIRSFYDWIHAYQESFFRDNLDRILRFTQLSLFGEVDPDITFEFKNLWQLDEAGEVGILQTKTAIDESNIGMGKITPQEARAREASDKQGLYAGLDLSQPIEQGAAGAEQIAIDPTTGQPMYDASGMPMVVDPETGAPVSQLDLMHRMGSAGGGGSAPEGGANENDDPTKKAGGSSGGGVSSGTTRPSSTGMKPGAAGLGGSRSGIDIHKKAYDIDDPTHAHGMTWDALAGDQGPHQERHPETGQYVKDEDKTTQAQAHYQDPAPDLAKRCAVCDHFRQNDTCEIVQGRIHENATCDKFRAEFS